MFQTTDQITIDKHVRYVLKPPTTLAHRCPMLPRDTFSSVASWNPSVARRLTRKDATTWEVAGHPFMEVRIHMLHDFLKWVKWERKYPEDSPRIRGFTLWPSNMAGQISHSARGFFHLNAVHWNFPSHGVDDTEGPQEKLRSGQLGGSAVHPATGPAARACLETGGEDTFFQTFRSQIMNRTIFWGENVLDVNVYTYV